MPIEVRELVIRATIDGGKGGENASGAAEKGGSAPPPADNKDIIEACVERVLEIIRHQQER